MTRDQEVQQNRARVWRERKAGQALEEQKDQISKARERTANSNWNPPPTEEPSSSEYLVQMFAVAFGVMILGGLAEAILSWQSGGVDRP